MKKKPATLKNGLIIFSAVDRLIMEFFYWSREWGSNPRPTVYDTVALPAELSRQTYWSG